MILVYSQYIDGGLVPIALALESMGLRRAGNKSLFSSLYWIYFKRDNAEQGLQRGSGLADPSE